MLVSLAASLPFVGFGFKVADAVVVPAKVVRLRNKVVVELELSLNEFELELVSDELSNIYDDAELDEKDPNKLSDEDFDAMKLMLLRSVTMPKATLL